MASSAGEVLLSRLVPANRPLSVSVQCLLGAGLAWSGEERDRIAAGVRAECVDQVGVEGAPLEAASRVGGEQAGDALLAVLGLAAEAELAVDDCATQGAFGVVVGRRLARVPAQDRLELAAQRPHAPLELATVAGVLEDLPGPEELRADPEAVLGELALGAEPVGVRGEVALQMRPADLAAAQR